MTSALPDQRLVGPGDHLDRLGQLTVTGNLPQLMGVGANHVGQRVRVTGVTLGARHTVPLPVPRRLQRIDCENPVAGGNQRAHPRSTIGLDAHGDLVSIGIGIKMLTQEYVQAGHPSHTLRDPGLRQPAS
jgi:hypothetical protein